MIHFLYLVNCCWADFIMLVNVSVTAVNMDVRICLGCAEIEYLVHIPEVGIDGSCHHS